MVAKVIVVELPAALVTASTTRKGFYSIYILRRNLFRKLRNAITIVGSVTSD
jgi:hypothetical protein